MAGDLRTDVKLYASGGEAFQDECQQRATLNARVEFARALATVQVLYSRLHFIPAFTRFFIRAFKVLKLPTNSALSIMFYTRLW